MWNQKPCILLAEDDENDYFILTRSLKKAGINNPVQWVKDGEEALDYLRGDHRFKNRKEFPFPGIVITDIKMPKVNGFEVLKWLRNHPECGIIPTIVLSSSAHEKDVVLAYQCGANCYLQKPLTCEEMTELMKLMFDFWSACKIPILSTTGCDGDNDSEEL